MRNRDRVSVSKEQVKQHAKRALDAIRNAQDTACANEGYVIWAGGTKRRKLDQKTRILPGQASPPEWDHRRCALRSAAASPDVNDEVYTATPPCKRARLPESVSLHDADAAGRTFEAEEAALFSMRLNACIRAYAQI